MSSVIFIDHNIFIDHGVSIDRDGTVMTLLPMMKCGLIVTRLLLHPFWSLHHVCCFSPCDHYITSVAPPLVIITSRLLLLPFWSLHHVCCSSPSDHYCSLPSDHYRSCLFNMTCLLNMTCFWPWRVYWTWRVFMLRWVSCSSLYISWRICTSWWVSCSSLYISWRVYNISLSCGVSIDLTDMITDHDVSIDCELIIDPDVSVDRDVPALSEHVRHHCAHTAYSASVRFFRLIH